MNSGEESPTVTAFGRRVGTLKSVHIVHMFNAFYLAYQFTVISCFKLNLHFEFSIAIFA